MQHEYFLPESGKTRVEQLVEGTEMNLKEGKEGARP
jgi:hypothetical protein